jgi:hypothetical protein
MSVHVIDIGGTVDHHCLINNKEWAIQRHRQHWEQNTEQRKSKNKNEPRSEPMCSRRLGSSCSYKTPTVILI